MTLEDLLIAARTVYGEARGEPFEGQRAVAHVILNRAKEEGGIARACLRAWQFSCWNPDDANFQLIQKVALDDKRFCLALRAVLEAFVEPDFTQGARHYHTRQVQPSWSRGRTPDLMIGNHLFFRGIP